MKSKVGCASFLVALLAAPIIKAHAATEIPSHTMSGKATGNQIAVTDPSFCIHKWKRHFRVQLCLHDAVVAHWFPMPDGILPNPGMETADSAVIATWRVFHDGSDHVPHQVMMFVEDKFAEPSANEEYGEEKGYTCGYLDEEPCVKFMHGTTSNVYNKYMWMYHFATECKNVVVHGLAQVTVHPSYMHPAISIFVEGALHYHVEVCGP